MTRLIRENAYSWSCTYSCHKRAIVGNWSTQDGACTNVNHLSRFVSEHTHCNVFIPNIIKPKRTRKAIAHLLRVLNGGTLKVEDDAI